MYTSRKKVSQKYIMAIIKNNNFSGKRKKAATSNAVKLFDIWFLFTFLFHNAALKWYIII